MYHIEFDIAAVFVTLFIAYYIIFKKGIRKHANRVFLGMISINFIAEISDIFGSLANNHPEYTTEFIKDFWNYLYISSHNTLAYVLVVYVFYLIGYEKSKRTALLISATPFVIEMILLFTNPFHKRIFYYDEAGNPRLWISSIGIRTQ